MPRSSAPKRRPKHPPSAASPPASPPGHREILIVSDATGRTAEMVVRAALVQFHGVETRLTVRAQVRTADDIRGVVQAAAASGGLIAHTLVQPELRSRMLTEARARRVVAIDLLGPLLLRIEELLSLQPVSLPGLFRPADEEYRRRFEAMDFTVRHDDGQEPQGLLQADIVLVGVSRTSKTPVSMLLAWHGHRVANVPVVHGLPLPEELARVDPRKVVGLTIKADRLLDLRRSRLQQMETPPKFPYAEPREIMQELDYARQCCGRAGWAVVDVTDKSVEEVASEILLLTGIERPPAKAAGSAGRPSAWRRTSE